MSECESSGREMSAQLRRRKRRIAFELLGISLVTLEETL